MNGTRRIKITDLNPNLICVLCGGYLIDATTLTECLHSFCKTCIVRYLKSNKHCPVCDVMVHKTRPLQNIRSDKTLQDLVYKLVPGLYKNEMKRRRDCYTQHPEAAPKKVGEARGDENAERLIYTEDEHFSLALHFCSEGVKDERSVRKLTLPEIGATIKELPKDVRYLQCPASVTISILKKFIRLKYELPHYYQIDVFHTDEALRDEYTLMDVAYIYTWRRREPLKLNYSVYESTIKRMRLDTPLTRVGLEFKPHVKIEGRQVTKPESKPSKPDNRSDTKAKPEAKPTTSEKPVVKQEAKQAAKHDPTSPVKHEAPTSGDKEEKKETDKDIKCDVSEKGEVKPSVEVVVGHVTTTTPSAAPAPPSTQGKKFFPNKSSSKTVAYGVKVLQSSKLHSLPNNTITKINPAAGGTAVKFGPVSKPVQDKVKLPPKTQPAPNCQPFPNGQPASDVQRSNAVQLSIDTLGQDNVMNTTDKQTAVPGSNGAVSVGAESVGAVSVGAVSVEAKVKTSVVQDTKSREAAGAAASAADVVTKTTRQQQPPPAASPATSLTTPYSSSSPATLTSSSRGGDSVTVSQSLLTVVSVPSTTVGGQVAAKCGLSTSTVGVPSARDVSAMTVPSVPAPVDSGAAAAGGDASPAPAALAASSSPSPPMATATSATKDSSDKQFHAPAPSAPQPSATVPTDTPTSCPRPVTSLPSCRPVTSTSRAPATANAAMRPTTSISTNVNNVGGVQGLMATTSINKAMPSKPSDRDSLCSSPVAKKARKSSPGRAVNTPCSTLTNSTTTSSINISNTANNNNNTGSVSSGLKVPVGIPTVVSNQTSRVAGRVCNGMPPVVSRMPRVSNAATSVNTLSHAPKQSAPASPTTTLKLPPSMNSPHKQPSPNSTQQKQATASNTPQKQATASNTPQKQATASNTPQKQVTTSNTPQKQVTASNSPQKLSSGNTAPKQSPAGNPLQKPHSAHKPSVGHTQKQSSNGVATERHPAHSTADTPPKSSPASSTAQRTMTLTRPNGASTPVAIQPANLSHNCHPLVRETSNNNSVAAAMVRHASEIQQAFVQQQQQQLFLQQHLFEQQRLQQFLQQQQLFSLQVAAARWKSPQASTTLTPIPISAGIVVSTAPPQYNGTGLKNTGITTSASIDSTTTPTRCDAEHEQPKKPASSSATNKQQHSSLSKKSPEPSHSKKKITDIANSLHKKMSQTRSPASGVANFQKPQQPAASGDHQRPPNAHTASGKRPESVSPTHGQTAQAHSSNKSPAPMEMAVNKGEDEPLNLSVVKSASVQAVSS